MNLKYIGLLERRIAQLETAVNKPVDGLPEATTTEKKDDKSEEAKADGKTEVTEILLHLFRPD